MQKALYARLSEDLGPIKVFAYVPFDKQHPFVTIHDFSIADESTKGSGIGAVTYSIGIASAEEGVLEIQGIIDKVVHSVSRAPFDLEGGWKHVLTRLEFCEAFPLSGEAEVIQTAELRFRFIVQDLEIQ